MSRFESNDISERYRSNNKSESELRKTKQDFEKAVKNAIEDEQEKAERKNEERNKTKNGRIR